MYNPEIKNKYIAQTIAISESQDIELYTKGLINRFNRTQDFEVKYGKDMLEMSQEEFKLFLGEFLKGGKGYQNTDLSMLKAYCNWGIENGICKLSAAWLNDLKLNSIDVSQPYKNRMVSCEADLIDCIDPLLDSINRDTKDNIIRCVWLLLFAGVQYEDIWYLKTEDVDLSARKIFYRNKVIQMTDALYEIIDHNLKMDQMLIVGKGTTTEYMKDIIKEGYLISNTREYFGDRRKMMKSYYAPISNKLSESPKKDLTNTTIYDSGVFYRMYLNEQKTGAIDCIEYLWSRRNSVTTIEYPNRVKANCIYEYQQWKKSFGFEV